MGGKMRQNAAKCGNVCRPAFIAEIGTGVRGGHSLA
jgi:hypothetical protein